VGALDEVWLFRGALTSAAIRTLAAETQKQLMALYQQAEGAF
jgi:hypothetical protein